MIPKSTEPETDLLWRDEEGLRLPVLVWRPDEEWRMISSAVVGGGISDAAWVLNAQVPGDYRRMDPAMHVVELADTFNLTGRGVGMLTAADVTKVERHVDEGVFAATTVGLRVPTWAAAPTGTTDPELAPTNGNTSARGGSAEVRPGTINILVVVPAVLTDGALVNAVITATEAKTQALLEAGYACTGTASDAVAIAARRPEPGEEGDPFAGPRSLWGARIARAVHTAVRNGAVAYRPA